MMIPTSRTEKALKFFAYLELVFSLASLAITIYALVSVTSAMAGTRGSYDKSISVPVNSQNSPIAESRVAVATEAPVVLRSSSRRLVSYMGIMLIKFIYFTMLFLISEACLVVFLLRTLRTRNLEHLRLWFIGTVIFAALYVTDFLSTVHAIALFEDLSVTLGAFVKIPLLWLGWKMYTQWSSNGTNLVNDV